MAGPAYRDEAESSTPSDASHARARASMDSISSISSTSAVLEDINTKKQPGYGEAYEMKTPLMRNGDGDDDDPYDPEQTRYLRPVEQRPSRTTRIVMWTLCAFCLGGWLLALFLFLRSSSVPNPFTSKPSNSSEPSSSPSAPIVVGSGKSVKFDDVLEGKWYPRHRHVKWIKGTKDEDGMIMEVGGGSDYLVVEDIRSQKQGSTDAHERKVLMKDGAFDVDGAMNYPNDVWPSNDFKKVLVLTDKQKNWRHSYTGKFFIFDVATQSAEPLDPADPAGRVQYAAWAPTSDAVVFTKDNNLYLRKIATKTVTQITTDGGPNLFYGIPDWVYEEEVFQDNAGTWWSEKGDYIAFLRTNETEVPEMPIPYFIQRPSGKKPKSGEENYPETKMIKYPKAGAPNPVVDLRFYDLSNGQVFSVAIENDFADNDRLITEIVWAGKDGKVLIRETNRESDKLKLVLVDVTKRSGKTVREEDVKSTDGGWFEVMRDTKFVPGDPVNGRLHDGYIDTVINGGYNHLAYFTPLDNPQPVLLTNGSWEVTNAPSAVDLKQNLVYFVSTRRGPLNRHVYSVKMDGTDLIPLTDEEKEAYYDVSFSTGAGYALLSNDGPGIPTQTIIGTPSNTMNKDFTLTMEENKGLAELAAKTELPEKIYSTVNVDGFDLQVVERRPMHFDESKKHPVLFFLYNGPMSQQVNKKWTVDFQSYLASDLGYVVVTVDGRGTGFQGRKFRSIIRDNIGYYEARDQIETAKIWASKSYIDSDRVAIWGWSYGGFTTLKTLEQDAGQTFKYGMAVAPVTDWRLYDSIYTERYMHTPQHNPSGFDNATISNMTAMAGNVRWLLMHGVSDDNVHFQNSLILLDKLDVAGVRNFDAMVFPDSDHSIYFHNANKMVYGRLRDWLINAFNGEWAKIANPRPLANVHLGTKFKRAFFGLWN